MIYISIIIAILAVILDQLFKYLVVVNIPLGDTANFIPGLLNFTYIRNTGVAFGMFKDARLFFIIFTLIVIGLILFFMIKNKDKSKVFYIACGLILGGGIGNLIDRIRLGYVIDFLSLSFFSPICNFADYCITAGTILLIIYLLFIYKSKPKNKEKANAKSSSNS